MRKLYQYLFLLSLILGLSNSSTFASHIVGGELNYEYLGNNQYKIILTIYRDGSGFTFDTPAKIGVYDINNNFLDSLELPYNGETNIIPTTGDPCLQLPTSGIDYRVTVYEMIVTLDYGIPGGYQLAYQRCCRNYTILNLEGVSVSPPSAPGATFYAKTPDNTNISQNSNPKFKNWAPTFICAGYPWIFDHSAIDPENDSLVYELLTPFTGGSTGAPSPNPEFSLPPFDNVVWKPPYSLANVFGGVPLTIDPRTGIMTATPNTQGQFVAGVRVKEYRNGIYIGETRRDFQVNIRACQPSVVAALSTSSIVCRNKTATFTNQSSGAGRYHWDFGVTGLTNDTSNATNPTYIYPDTGSYKVKLIAYSADLVTCTDTTIIDVYIAAKLTADFTFTGIPCIPTINYIDASNRLRNTNNTFKWDFGDFSPVNTLQNPSHTYSSASTYNVTLIVTSPFLGCKDTIIKPVSILNKPPVDAGPNKSICLTKSVTIGTPSQPGFNYSWLPPSGLDNSLIAQPQASPVGNTTYILTMSNADNSCTAKDTVIITVNPLPTVDAGTDNSICSLDTVNIGSSPVGSNIYSWSPGTNLSNPAISNPKAFPSLTTTYTVTATTTLGCTKSDDVIITAIPLPIADAGPDKDACILNTSTPIGSPNNPSYNYNWSPAGSLNNFTISNPVASPVSTQTYFLTVTDPGTTCKNKDQVIVNVLPLPSISAGPDKGVCIGSSIAIGTVNNPAYTYSWAPAISLDNANSATPNASPTVNTTYILTSNYTSVTCTKKDTVVVTVRAIPTAFAGSDQFICPGSSTALGTGSNVNYDYSWTPTASLNNPNVSSPIATPSVTTTYTLTVFDKIGLCYNTDQVVVTLVQPAALTGPTVSVCNKDSVQIGSANDPQLIYSWTPSLGLSNTGVSNPKAGPTVTTTYTLNVTDKDFGCMNQAQVIVNVLPLPLAEAGNPVSLCLNGQGSIGSADLGFNYSWLPITGLSNPVSSAPLANPAISTRYYLTVKSNTNPQCTSKDSVDVTINPLPSVNAGRDTAICSLLSTQLGENNNPAHTYKWKYDLTLSDSLISDPIASPTGTRTYYLTVTDISTGCKNSDQVIVSINPLPTTDAGNDDTLCTGRSVQIGAANNPLYSYSWLPVLNLDNAGISDPTATLTASQQYFLTVTDQNGCIKKDTVALDVIAYPSVNAGPDLFTCYGDPIRIGTPANPLYKYKWTPGTFLSDSLSANPITTSPDSIKYYIVATELTGYCSAMDSVFVSVYRPAINIAPAQAVCAGSGAHIGSLTVPGYVYSWTPTTGLDNPASADPLASPSITTTYTLNITDNGNGGCKNSASLIVTVNPLPVFNPVPVLNICIGGDTLIGMNNNNTDYTFSWTPAPTLDDNTLSNPRANPVTSTTYILTVVDTSTASLCSITRNVALNVNPLPVIKPHTPKEICEGDSVRIGATSNNTYTYSWNPSIGLSNPLDSMPKAAPMVNTTYTLTVTNSFGCKDSREDTVNVALSDLALGDNIKICKFDSVALNPTGNITYDSYKWTPNSALSPSDIVPNPKANPLLTTSYILMVKKGACVKNDTILIDVSADTLTAFAGNSPKPICKGTPYTLTPRTTGGATGYVWSTSNLYTDTLNAPGDTTAIVNPVPKVSTYYLKVSNDHGCMASSSIQIVKDSVLISMNSDIVCEDNQARISISNTNNNTNLIYHWVSDNDILSDLQNETLLIAGANTDRIFYVTATDAATTCSVKDSAYVTISRINGARAYSDKHVIYEGEITNLKAFPADNNIYTYHWSTLEIANVSTSYQTLIAPLITTTYSLEIKQISAPYCLALDTALITVIQIYPCGEPDIFVPNAFSPDGNGSNDVLFVRGNSIKSMEFIIFNRWGEKVFEAKDQREGWDGNYLGKPADVGVYVYYLKATCTGDGAYVKKGNITLLK